MARLSIFIVLHFISVIAKNIPESPVKNIEEILDVSICFGFELTSDCEKVCENENLKPLCTQLNLGLCVCEFPTQNNELNDNGKAVIIKLDLNQTHGLDKNKQKNMNDENSAATNTKVQNEQQATAQNQKKEYNDNIKVSPDVKEATKDETVSKTDIAGHEQLVKDPLKEVTTPKNEITSLTEVHPQPNIATLDHEGNKVTWSVKPFAWKLNDQDDKQSRLNTLIGDKGTTVNAESDTTKNDKMNNLEQSKDEKSTNKNIKIPITTAGIKQTIDAPTLTENYDRSQPIKPTVNTISENNEEEHGHQIEKPEINKETTTSSLNHQNTSKKPEEMKQNNGNKYLKENEVHDPETRKSKQLIINSGELDETDELKNTKSSTVGKDNELIQVFDKAKKENIILDQKKETDVSGNLLPKSESDIDLFISNETFIMSGIFIYIALCLLFLYARSYRKKKYVRLPLLQHEDDTNDL